MAKTKLEEARERLEAAVAAEDACDGGENPLSHVSVSADDLCAILAELDRRSPPTREASPIIERLESIAHHFESSGYAHGQHVDKARAAREAARMIAALAAAPPPPDVSRGLDREEVAAIPADLLERILAVGKVEWGAVGARSDTRHLQDFANTLQITREEFGLGEEQALQGVYLEGTATVLCHTGTSPNSGQHARILVGAWNRLHDIALSAPADTGRGE